MKGRSTLALLGAMPRRFRFDAAVRVLARARRTQDPAQAVRFRSPAGLVYPPADVLEVRQQGDALPEVTTGLIGLTGPSGVLPHYYTEIVIQTLRARSTALRDFLDLLAHRFVAFFARAGVKYRPARAAEVAALGSPMWTPSRRSCWRSPGTARHILPTGWRQAASRCCITPASSRCGPRSADRLGALISDWLGMKVEVLEFAGAWLPLPPDQRTRLSANGAWCRLGVDAAAGVRAWDPQARIILRIGPLDLPGFQRLLPDRIALHRLVSLVRAYLGFEIGFAINPVLAARQVPPLRLDAHRRTAAEAWLEHLVPGPAGGFTARATRLTRCSRPKSSRRSRSIGAG